MVDRYGPHDATPIGLPYARGDNKRPTEVVDCNPSQTSNYRSLTVSLLYATLVHMPTRLDINETVTRLCRAMRSPKTIDTKKAIICLRHLKITANMGLQFSINSGLVCYCDNNWGDNLEHRLSKTGYAFMLNNAAITFRSMMQKSQSLIAAGAEYIAHCVASHDACYLLQMLSELAWMGDNAPTVILEDNQAAITNVVKDVASPKLKHVDIRFPFVRSMYRA